MLAVPLVGPLGSKALWGLLPFMALALGGIRPGPEYGLEYRTGRISDAGAA